MLNKTDDIFAENVDVNPANTVDLKGSVSNDTVVQSPEQSSLQDTAGFSTPVSPDDFAFYTSVVYNGIPKDAEFPSLKYAEGPWKYYLSDDTVSEDGTFFEEYGYSCSTASYSESSVVTSLMNGQPVIISAHPTGFLGIPDFQHGHTFVIDGYRREKQVSECLYKWVDAHTGQYNDTLHPDYFEIYTGSPQISRIKMNWGWWTQWIAGYDVNGVFHDHEIRHLRRILLSIASTIPNSFLSLRSGANRYRFRSNQDVTCHYTVQYGHLPTYIDILRLAFPVYTHQ